MFADTHRDSHTDTTTNELIATFCSHQWLPAGSTAETKKFEDWICDDMSVSKVIIG